MTAGKSSRANPDTQAKHRGAQLMNTTLAVIVNALLFWYTATLLAGFDLLPNFLPGADSMDRKVVSAAGKFLFWTFLFSFVTLCVGWQLLLIVFCGALRRRDALHSTMLGRAFFWIMILPGLFPFVMPFAFFPSAWKQGAGTFRQTLFTCAFFWLGAGLTVCGEILWSSGDVLRNGCAVPVNLLLLGFLCMALGWFGLYFCIQRLSRSPWLVPQKRVFAVAVGLFLLAPFVAHGLFRYTERAVACEKTRLQSLNASPDVASYRNLFTQGRGPDEDWTEFVRLHADDLARYKKTEAYSLRTQPFSAFFATLRDSERGPFPEGVPLYVLSGVTFPDPWFLPTETDFSALQTFLDEHAETLLTLSDLFAPGRLPLLYARHFDGAASIVDISTPDLSVFRFAQDVFLARMILAAHFRSPGRVMEQVRRCDTLLRSLLSDPSTISSLYAYAGISLLKDALGCVFAGRVLSDEDLREIEDTLAALDDALGPALRRAFRGEVSVAGVYETMILTAGGPMRLNHSAVSPLRSTLLAPAYCFLQNEYAALLRQFTELLTQSNDPNWNPISRSYAEIVEQSSGDGDKNPRRSMFVRTLFPRYSLIWYSMASASSHLRLARIACRVERFRLREGRLPATLDELGDLAGDLPPDPFSKNPFFYRPGEVPLWRGVSLRAARREKTAHGYLLYGVGPNLADGGGKFFRGAEKDEVLTVLDPGSIQDAKLSDEKKEFGAEPGKNQGDQKHE